MASEGYKLRQLNLKSNGRLTAIGLHNYQSSTEDIAVRIFITAEHPDFKVLNKFATSLANVKAGRRLKQTYIGETSEAPACLGDVIEEQSIKRLWKYKEKVWTRQLYIILDLTLPNHQGVLYVRGMCSKVLRSLLGKSKVKAAVHSFSIYNLRMEVSQEILSRIFPQEDDDGEW